MCLPRLASARKLLEHNDGNFPYMQLFAVIPSIGLNTRELIYIMDRGPDLYHKVKDLIYLQCLAMKDVDEPLYEESS